MQLHLMIRYLITYTNRINRRPAGEGYFRSRLVLTVTPAEGCALWIEGIDTVPGRT
jgi:hypothetical protein